MSGYGGQPPPGWQDPYGQNPYGQNPYGQNPYAQNPYGQQQGWQDPYAQQQAWQDPYAAAGIPGMAPMPAQPASNAAAVGAIIGNCVGLVFICGIGIAWLPGLILGGMAVSRIDSDPEAARSLTRASWICCAANFVIEALIILLVVLANQ
jgi:hypothetical protein